MDDRQIEGWDDEQTDGWLNHRRAGVRTDLQASRRGCFCGDAVINAARPHWHMLEIAHETFMCGPLAWAS